MLRFLLLALIASFHFTASSQTPSALIPPDEPIAGITQQEWSERWWNWAFGFQREESPVADRTGEFCAAKQTADVWYLAGTYGTRRTVRTCRVPANKVIFFPLVNSLVVAGQGPGSNCMAVASQAARLMQPPSSLVLELDGKRFEGLEAHRQASRGCFPLSAAGQGSPLSVATNGYYIALRPLAPGTHTLEFGGIVPGISQAVTYTLIAE